jgi:cytochrome P450
MSASPVLTPVDSPEDFRLVHPEDYAAHGYPHRIWTRLRAEDPVSWQVQPGNAKDYWALTKHADITLVSKRPDLFVSAPRIVIQPYEEEITGFPATLIQMDPPIDADHPFRANRDQRFPAQRQAHSRRRFARSLLPLG